MVLVGHPLRGALTNREGYVSGNPRRLRSAWKRGSSRMKSYSGACFIPNAPSSSVSAQRCSHSIVASRSPSARVGDHQRGRQSIRPGAAGLELPPQDLVLLQPVAAHAALRHRGSQQRQVLAPTFPPACDSATGFRRLQPSRPSANMRERPLAIQAQLGRIDRQPLFDQLQRFAHGAPSRQHAREVDANGDRQRIELDARGGTAPSASS